MLLEERWYVLSKYWPVQLRQCRELYILYTARPQAHRNYKPHSLLVFGGRISWFEINPIVKMYGKSNGSICLIFPTICYFIPLVINFYISVINTPVNGALCLWMEFNSPGQASADTDTMSPVWWQNLHVWVHVYHWKSNYNWQQAQHPVQAGHCCIKMHSQVISDTCW